jgi:hypothetical protein
VTGYGLVIGAEILLFSTAALRTSLGTSQPHITWVQSVLPPGINRWNVKLIVRDLSYEI